MSSEDFVVASADQVGRPQPDAGVAAKPSAIATWLLGAPLASTLWSLKHQPQRWRQVGWAYLVHDSGFRVWRANQPYGVEIEDPFQAKVWGGVTFASTFGLSIGHHLLTHAIRRWTSAGVASAFVINTPTEGEKRP